MGNSEHDRTQTRSCSSRIAIYSYSLLTLTLIIFLCSRHALADSCDDADVYLAATGKAETLALQLPRKSTAIPKEIVYLTNGVEEYDRASKAINECDGSPGNKLELDRRAILHGAILSTAAASLEPFFTKVVQDKDCRQFALFDARETVARAFNDLVDDSKDVELNPGLYAPDGVSDQLNSTGMALVRQVAPSLGMTLPDPSGAKDYHAAQSQALEDARVSITNDCSGNIGKAIPHAIYVFIFSSSQ